MQFAIRAFCAGQEMRNSDATTLLSEAAADLTRLARQPDHDGTDTEPAPGIVSLARMAAALWDSLRLRPADNDVAVMTMQNIDALAAAVENEAGSALEHEALRSIAARLRSRRDVPPPQRQADECRS